MRAPSYRTNRDLISNHYPDDLLPETEAWPSVDAAELDEKIEKTDRHIDEIVYERYRLTGEEIEIVESAVGD